VAAFGIGQARIDDDYQALRLNMETLFHDLGISA
jgi:hypothetical protein